MNHKITITNQNNNLYVVELSKGGASADDLAFTPIIAWDLVSMEADPKWSYAEPITIVPTDDRVVVERSTMAWWWLNETSGVGVESLVAHLKSLEG